MLDEQQVFVLYYKPVMVKNGTSDWRIKRDTSVIPFFSLYELLVADASFVRLLAQK